MTNKIYNTNDLYLGIVVVCNKIDQDKTMYFEKQRYSIFTKQAQSENFVDIFSGQELHTKNNKMNVGDVAISTNNLRNMHDLIGSLFPDKQEAQIAQKTLLKLVENLNVRLEKRISQKQNNDDEMRI